MSNREPIEWVEIDVDQCTLTYGTGACTAALGVTGELKCFNTFKTCQDKLNYDLGSLTYTFAMSQSHLPTKVGVFPVLQSIRKSPSLVNIAGHNPDVVGVGKRETVSFTLSDFPYHDRYTDKYASERVTGVAQSSGIGYNPEDRGTFFGKMRSRFPYYAGRPARYCRGFIDNGVLVDVVKQHYIITDMDVDYNSQTAHIEAKDILWLADDKKAVAPIASDGKLISDISDTDTALTLQPTGVGDGYPTSGRAIIGSEIVDYTRVDDVITLVTRGVSNTEVSGHSLGDAFQEVFTADIERIDSVISRLLVDYAGVPSSYIPTTKWSDEVTRWASSLYVSVDISKPVGVNKLLGELAVLGMSIWWDSELQEIGLKINRPPDEDTVYEVSDNRNIRAVELVDNDDDRLTQVGIYTDIDNPTKSITDGSNYNKALWLIDIDAQTPFEFNDTSIRQIYSRWLGVGDDNLVRIIAKRLLNRFRWSPTTYTFRIKADQDIRLTDVISMDSRIAQDDTGLNELQLMQVISIKRTQGGEELEVIAQSYQFDQNYGYIVENTRPVYTASTDAQKARGAYFADDVTLEMSDGSPPYQFI